MLRNWRSILFYGVLSGILLVALQVSQYHFLIVNHAVEWYIGLIALLFTVLGVWVGNRLTRPKPVVPEVSSASTETVVAKLGLTQRELEVLQLMSQGLSNQEIADQLFVSLNTVKTHASNLFSKLNAQRRTQAISNARTYGIVVPAPSVADTQRTED